MNKMFKKLLAVAAVVATAACLSVPAFAAEVTITDAKDNVGVTGYTTVADANQYTVMIFKYTPSDDVTVDNATPALPTDIYYINQGSELYDETNKDGLLDQMLVKLDDGETGLPVGDYVVRIGNDGTGAVVSLGLSVSGEATIIYGDVNDSGAVDAFDVRDLKRHLAEWDGYGADALNLDAADVNGSGAVDAFDVRDLKRHLAEWDGYLELPIN